MIQENEKGRKKGGKRRLSRIAAAIMAIWAVSVIVVEILLSTSIVTNTVSRIAGRYIDGDISFGKVSASLFKNFPSVTLSLEDFSITYPSDRFDISENNGPQGALMYRGCGEDADTLATFSRFSARVRVFPLLFGRLNIPGVTLENPSIYAHAYADGKANWNIFMPGDSRETDSDTTSTELPAIRIGKIRLTDDTQIVYTDSRDTIFAMMELKQAGFDGRLSTGKKSRNKVGLTIDSLFVAGRIAADTLAVGLDRLRIHEHNDHMDINLQAKTMVATRSFGRLDIPVDLDGTVHFPKDSVPAVGIHNFRAEIAAIPLEGEADLRFHDGRTEIDGRLSVQECKVNEIIRDFASSFIPEITRISTDAVIGIDAVCKGDYIHESGKLPSFRIDLSLPQSKITHKDLGEDIHLAFDASMANTRQGRLNLNINNLAVSTEGLQVSAYGGLLDMLADDPTINIDGKVSASLDTLTRFLPDSLNIIAEGDLGAEVSGTAKLSELSIYTFSRSGMTGKAVSDRLLLDIPEDSLKVVLDGLNMELGPETVTSKRDSSQSFNLMGISGKADMVDVSYKSSLALKGKDISISAKNSVSESDTSHVNRLGGRFSAGNLTITDMGGASVRLDRTQNGFQMMPKTDNPEIPVLTLTSANKRIALTTDVNRAILTDASVQVSAAMNSIERRQKVRNIRDSLAKAHPDVPEDSLFIFMMSQRQTRELPAWLQEEDFRKQDIDIRLDRSLAKYFRDWDLHGDINVRTGILMTPYFPLRNILRGMEICFTNDRIAIDSLRVMSGGSGIEAKGELTGLRRALTGGNGNRPSRSVLKLDLDISTDRMNANEILTAYNAGSHFNPEKAKDKMSEASDSEFLQMVISDTAAVQEEPKLIVIPGNLNADISIKGKDIRYSDLDISSLNADLMMKERCVQITNTMATSNIGDVSFEGFYATRSKQDIKAGFNFDFKDITAEKAIDLIPAVDSIMPLLKSFAGKLNCGFAATASLDTNMNILPHTIDGVIRIKGDDITISNSDLFTSLAKKLKFDDSKTGKINRMTVEGVIKDNVLEVFPFVLSLDRYTLALSGKQNLDMSYRYHASLIRSPMLIKVGVDLYGPDFDNIKFKIGKPKYRSENVPVFTSVIDQTRINLAESIRNIFEKGVEAAVEENARQQAIEAHRKETGYINAVDQTTEELSEEEQKELEAATAEDESEPSGPSEVMINETTENQHDNEQSGIY